MTQNDITYIKAIITGKVQCEFYKIKEYYGLKSNAEVIRQIIRREYERLFPNSESPIELEAVIHE